MQTLVISRKEIKEFLRHPNFKNNPIMIVVSSGRNLANFNFITPFASNICEQIWLMVWLNHHDHSLPSIEDDLYNRSNPSNWWFSWGIRFVIFQTTSSPRRIWRLVLGANKKHATFQVRLVNISFCRDGWIIRWKVFVVFVGGFLVMRDAPISWWWIMILLNTGCAVGRFVY